jgi:DNA-binding MarR family transcriptional regulator
MPLREELMITKDMHPGQELILAVLLTREFVARLSDKRLFKPAGITDQQFNVLRILKGGPPEGSLIREIRRRIITCRADVPRLVDRMARAGLVSRREDPGDRRGCLVALTTAGAELEARLAPVHDALCAEVAGILPAGARAGLVEGLEALRAGLQRTT